MSFTSVDPATPRLQRSELAVPGSNTGLFEKASKSPADIVFLDLEDAVAPDDKAQARKNIIQALNEIDWGAKTMMVRINGLDTHYMYRDVIDIVEACARLDMILIPKAGVAADVYAVDMLVTQVETSIRRTKRIGFEVLIETALGMANVETIAQSSKRLEAMSFGVADYAALHAGAHHRDRRGEQGLRRPHGQGRGGQAAISLDGSVACRANPHAHCVPRLRVAADRRPVRGTSTTRTVFALPPTVPQCSAMRANGRSIPRRSDSATKCSPRPPRKSPRHGASSRRWSRPQRRGAEPYRSTDG